MNTYDRACPKLAIMIKIHYFIASENLSDIIEAEGMC